MVEYRFPKVRQARNGWRFAWSTSLTLHASVLCAALLALLMQPDSIPTPNSSAITIDGRWARGNEEQIAIEIDAGKDPASVEGRVLPDPDDPNWTAVMAASRDAPIRDDENPSAVSSFLNQQLQASIRRGQQRSEETNRQRLSQLSRKLSENSSPQGVDELAGFLSGWMDPRAGEPADGSSDKAFDVQTAQIDRVRKEDSDSGGVRYIATMIDSSGITQEIELDRDTGEQLYKTMRLIESNPLLASVYRKIVMGILDGMLRGQASSAGDTR